MTSARPPCVALLMLALSQPACVEPAAVVCDDGTLCPSGATCIVGSGCVSNDLLAACDGKDEGDPCTLAGVGDGACAGGQCLVRLCGNGRLEAGETCDDHNQASGDGCSYDCLSDESCGNGYVDEAAGEQCDCGDDDDGSLPAACAEPNGTTPTATCRVDCIDVRCGNGLPDPGEVCDDGNQTSGDGCSYDCRSVEACGNDYADFAAGEQCDEGAARSHDGCASACRLEVTAWTLTPPDVAPLFSGLPVATFDGARAQVIAYDSYWTWTWSGNQWRGFFGEVDDPTGNPYEPALGFDPSTGRTIRFGGGVGGNFPGVPVSDQTWVLEGDRWVKVEYAFRPPGRIGATLVYDEAAGELLLIGGEQEGGLPLGDTWALGPAGWTLRDAGPNPFTGTDARVAYDATSARVVALSGHCDTTLYAWDGSTWNVVADVAPPATPFAAPAALVADPRRAALLAIDAVSCNDGVTPTTWMLRDGAWSESEPWLNGPLTGVWLATYDARHGEALVVKSDVGGDLRTWAWLGDELWDDRPVGPTFAPNYAMAYDPTLGALVAHGTSGTWTFDGAAWQQVRGVVPPRDWGSRIAYDPTSRRTLAFGGSPTNPATAGTWALDDTGWQQLAIANPPPRWFASMATDPARGHVVLFGGNGAAGSLADTWIFDGATWVEVDGEAPPSRADAGLAYDSTRGQLVLSGGASFGAGAFIPSPGSGLIALREDTWAFDGTTWTELTLATALPARAGATLVGDLGLGRVRAIGGYDADGEELAQVWELGPTGWLDLQPANPLLRRQVGAAYDPVRHRITTPDGWELRTDVPQPDSVVPEESCVAAVDADDDGRVGCDDPDCWARCTPACRPGDDCDPGLGPRCGDGVCAPVLEAGTLCPGDCDVCGDGVCARGYEDRATCAADCGTCGDGTCTVDESALTCPGDCGAT